LYTVTGVQTCALPISAVEFAYGRDELLEIVRRATFNIVAVDSEIIYRDAARFFALIGRELPEAAVLVTMQPSKTNTARQMEIAACGTAEFLVKPIYGSYAENLEMLKQKLEAMLAVPREKNRSKEPAKPVRAACAAKAQRLVLVAASTGGQQALEAVLPDIPGDFPAAILVVLHMPAHSTDNITASLNKKSALSVKVAREGEPVEPGCVYIAPGGLHMTLSPQKSIRLEDSKPINGLKPAADVLFGSVASCGAWREVLAVILTGMGKDGAKGLAEMKRRLDCRCIAQSERTCTVYGMPKAAVDGGLADRILDLGEIAHGVETFGFSPLPHVNI
jgi:two-component system chemotaxis response regulator CheB